MKVRKYAAETNIPEIATNGHFPPAKWTNLGAKNKEFRCEVRRPFLARLFALGGLHPPRELIIPPNRFVIK